MQLTRSEVEAMSEEDLREKVVVPLLERMGFRDVFVYHGGVLEQGKDVVMWKPGELGERRHFAVVLKATRVSGQASGSSSAATVKTQIEQAFGTDYLDPITNEAVFAGECWAVNSHAITKEAHHSIKGMLKTANLDRITRFVDGDALWRLIEEYSPERLVIRNLQKAKELFDSLDPDYQLVAKTGPGDLSLTVHPKEGSGPLPISTQFVFPDSEAGNAVKEDYQRFLKTGSPVSIPGEFVRNIQLPEFTKFLLPAEEGRVEGIRLSTASESPPVPLRAAIRCDDGTVQSLEYLDLRVVQAGTEEATLDNSAQPTPFKVTVTFNAARHSLQFSYSFEFRDANCKQELDGLCFAYAMNRGGEFVIEHLDTGIELNRADVSPGQVPQPDEDFLRLLEDVVFVQTKVKVAICVPETIAQDEIGTLYQVVQILRQGFVNLSELKVGIVREDVESFLGGFDQEKPRTFGGECPHAMTLFGSRITLGRGVAHCDAGFITEENRAEATAALRSVDAGATIQVTLTAAEGSGVRLEFPDWISSQTPGTE